MYYIFRSILQCKYGYVKTRCLQRIILGNRRIYTKSADGAPAKYGPNAKVSNSLISSGCEIDGEVENSVIFRGSQIAEGAVIKNSVVMAEGFIAPQAEINHTILDRHVKFIQMHTYQAHQTIQYLFRKEQVLMSNNNSLKSAALQGQSVHHL